MTNPNVHANYTNTSRVPVCAHTVERASETRRTHAQTVLPSTYDVEGGDFLEELGDADDAAPLSAEDALGGDAERGGGEQRRRVDDEAEVCSTTTQTRQQYDHVTPSAAMQSAAAASSDGE